LRFSGPPRRIHGIPLVGVTPRVVVFPRWRPAQRIRVGKNFFFKINARVIPGNMVFRTFGEEVLDIPPADATLDSSLYRYLSANPTDIQPLSELSMVALGMSRWWDLADVRPS
jgi:hypothetical protein